MAFFPFAAAAAAVVVRNYLLAQQMEEGRGGRTRRRRFSAFKWLRGGLRCETRRKIKGPAVSQLVSKSRKKKKKHYKERKN